MARRTKLLLSVLVSLCLLGAISGADNEIQDFEFADIDEAKVVKRSSGFSDDEDILGVREAGSAPDQEEGSGRLDDSDSGTLSGPVVSDYPRYFRVVINITSLIYSPQLADRNSQEFQVLANQVKRDIEQTLRGTQGQQAVTILSFSRGSVIATFDLGSEGPASEEELRGALETAIISGRIGSYAVSAVGFSFTALDPVVHCPASVGRSPDYLPRKGSNWANLMINNIFPCEGSVVAWEYYRIDPQGSAFVGVWRQNEDAEFILISKTELSSAPIGLRTVQLDAPIQVKQGDFIGIFYHQSAPNNVIAQATLIDDAVSDTELYQTYSVQFFENSVQPGTPFDINQFDNFLSNATFSIRALMNYDQRHTHLTEAAFTCGPNKFSCRDSYCIEAEYVCDGQSDCNNGLDEHNCPSLLEPCIEGRFRCNDGTCINRILKCDGKPDCPDGSDEFRCTACRDGQFTCFNGQCIPEFLHCNGQNDCQDRSDEEDCKTGCKEDDFTCRNGDCIHISRKCDAYPDCDDRSDEDPVICLSELTTFPTVCDAGYFKCILGGCVALDNRCDGNRDCLDGSDELDCVFTCGVSQFTCNSGQCVDGLRRCDSVPDCDDQSDESGCPCRRNQFECDDGQCVSGHQRCDRLVDCRDGSDERGCPCQDGEFRCGDGQCISVGQVCDRRSDCRDSSDEIECELCRRNEFQCNDGSCIDRRNRCDRSSQCADHSDEFNCTCNPAEFRCHNGQCIPQQSFCDQRQDCYDGTDETNCPIVCRGDQFTCASGECIDSRRTCDGRTDCQDSSDEQNCPVPPSSQCMPGQFRCATGQCIDAGFKCDRQIDCLDRSDETRCPTARPCPENQFQCDSGHCLDLQRRCDGRTDCPSGSDELDCLSTGTPIYFLITQEDLNNRVHELQITLRTTCSSVEFTCSSGQCISSSLRCDRQSDCQDGSDERGCPCTSGEFTCVNDGRCLPPGYRCNGNPDCRDGSDEQDCECSQSEFRCSSGQCVDGTARCNRRFECQDGSDEVDCVPQCTAREFKCSNNQCVDNSVRCDGRFDCSDGSDERGCPSGITINISPQQMRKRVGTSASFICQVTGNPPPRIVWSRRTGGAMPPQAVDSNGRLTIVNLRLEDAGDYLCQAISTVGTFEANARLDVDYIGPPTGPPDPEGPCGRDQSTCTNGQCIPRDYVCDGEEDCADKSDEIICNVVLPCEPNEFRCNNGRCALKIWRCDGDNDCLDNSDESNCPTRIPGAPCRTDEFVCRTNNQCIPSAYQCDGELDCQDRSDEIGCIPPSIVVPPVHEITVEVNGTFTIICEAVGVPTPLIVWRLNWGNIPSGDRVTVTSIDGRGALIVRNAVPEDAGAYTCEAINNRGSIFAVPDALIIVRRTIGVCHAPRFNADATRLEECIRCFCFGQTQTCYSSNLQISQITLGNQVALVRRTTLEPTEQGFIQYIPSSREFEVRDFNNVLRSGSYYWSLPYQYLSKRLSSYGGELSYRVYYEVDGFDVPTGDPDVIISGNGITLYHRSQTGFRPKTPTTVKVPLVEAAWERSRDSPRGGPISEYATRDDLMLVLENVTTILIRASYDNRQSLIRLGNVLLTTGVTQVTGLGRAVNVEECTCPTGYTGYSCEQCAPGFYRVEQGRYGRECVACNCNGRSNDCDPATGICRNCRDNSAGPFCDECAVGYIGDLRSNVCQPCPCPLTIPSNQFSRTCVLDQLGEIICTACPEGYTGQRCERCADRFQGNPLVPGDRCIPKDADLCDGRGSISNLPDAETQQCTCKANVEGQYCSRCKHETFHLSSENPYGCISCFCMGVSQTCQSTTWNRAQVSLPFSQSSTGVVLSDMMQKETVSEGISVDRQSRELVFRSFNNVGESVRYWLLPQQFLGDKVTSYGGNLRFTIRYRAGRDRTPVSLSDPLVEIGGNDITLFHRTRIVVAEGQQQSFSIPFIETHWDRMDEGPTNREHLLMALADLKFILIRATYTRDTDESAISGITMDIAESRDTGQERAYSVEQCACPRGYKGLSCEDCDTGYTRSGRGLYLGLCAPCRCNGHSSECDPETGVCRNCRHNTQGQNCELCSRGYYGDATRGTVNDCQKCPCPLTESPNQFSPECVLSTDGHVTCSSCPIGHTGRRCERCASGYEGNPNQPGDFCKLINVTCDCDGRGTVANTLCDPNTQQCQCKNNVQGRRCSACLDGYFNLNRDNEMGCLKCFCMGVSGRCSSSTYYRDEITPMLNSDGTHNFQLTNRRLSRTISDGFNINAERNEITFNNFEGIQREQESLFFSLPAKFKGDKISSYGGYLRFGLSFTTSYDTGRDYMDVDVEIISKQDKRMYYLHRPSPKARESYSYDILLTESAFKNLMDGQTPSREAFMAVLADIDAILIRATYHTAMDTVTLRDLRMEIAVPRPTGQRGAPEVESCICPEGYTGLSCQECAPGYLRVEESGTALGRCVRCICNGHATSCDPDTGVCQNCQHNTVGDRCDRCAPGYFGDPSAGTAYDCRTCPCPLTIPSNQFSPTCILDQDSRVTCDRCPAGYTGRDCGQCVPGYQGNPREPGGRCERVTIGQPPEVTVNPASLSVPLGSTAIFQCVPSGRSPFDVVWSRIDGRPLPRRATQGPGPNYLLTVTNVEFADSARYVCQVTNAHGTTREYGTLNVERLEPSLRVRIEEPTTIVTRLGQTARFVCVAVQYSLAANYVLSWTKDGGVLPSKSIDQNGVLIIPNLNENDLGSYTCTGSDPGSVDRATATITFGPVQEPPSVRIEPRYLQVDEGDRVEFLCIVEGSPKPVIRWTKGESGPLPSHIYTDETGIFRIQSVSTDDQSEYHCTATNSQGTSSVRTIIYVQRQTPIQVIIRRTNITAIIGRSEQLVCYAEGNNEVILIWSRDGGLPLEATQENGILTLPNIQHSYAGTYICTGRTPTGIIGTATARITVTGTAYEPPTVRVEPDRQTIGTGTTGTLRCIVTGEPRPVITWSRTNGQLSANHQVNGEFLRILQAGIDDRGIYVCSASNVAGTAQASSVVEIERREIPIIELYPDIQQVRPIGSSALFQCRVVGGIPAPVITWTRAGGREFTSRTEVKDDMGVIRFSAITPEEQGEYMCSATNEVGTITATASIRVEGPPVIEITPGNRITSLIGQKVNIECVGIGDPIPTVFWRSGQRRRSDVLPEAYETGPGTARLLFESIQKGDEGQYICVATNERGRAEETVEVVVREDNGSDQPTVFITGPDPLSLVTGQSVEVTCSSQGLPNPRFRWRRPGNQPLPPGHSVRNGVLYIPRIEPEYAGEYICSVVSEAIGADFSASIYIIVNVTPRLTINPSRVIYRPGQALQLRCQPSGQGQFKIEWTKLDGQLSPQARDRDGVLDIRQVTRADAGRYRCVASNAGGFSEGFADVVIQAPPVVDAIPKQNKALIGSTLEIRCNAQGDPPPAIQWEKDRGSLPLQHQIRNGVLTIYNIQPSDSGRYICTASNDAGSANDYTVVAVEDPYVESGPGVQRVGVGDRVELECVVTSAFMPTVTWTKLEGPLPHTAIIGNGILIIPEVRSEDAGTYQCTATNLAGAIRSRVQLVVESRPVFSVQQDYTTAALGTPAQLRCDASGSPEPRISWIKEGGDLPYDHAVLEDGGLLIPKVQPEDGGTYNCLASNKHGISKYPVVLVIGAFIPYFQQNPVSYISYDPLRDVYLDLDILVSFRPEATDGLLLFNGQYNTGSGDFVCFGMQGQYPEFRYDVGSGAATIRGAQPLELNKWHTVHLKRNRKNGTMLVNDEPPYHGESIGDFQGLDLAEPLYVGNVPEYVTIPASARFSSGFIGGVSQMKVKGVDINLGTEAREMVKVEQYLVCGDEPCLNGGSCQLHNNRFGFICDCPRGFTGQRCEVAGERCYQGACGPQGRCYNLPGISGFGCLCPLGYAGEGCIQRIRVADPAFNKTSFISYPTISDGLLSVRIKFLLKPRSLDDGIVLYNAQRQDGKQDFIAVIIRDQHLEFRFDTGSGPAVLRSRRPLVVDDWTMVLVDRKGRDGMLIVNNDEIVSEQVEPSDELLFSRLNRGDVIRGTSNGDKTVGLNLQRPLYLGGVDPFETINPFVGLRTGFVGCVGELLVGDKAVRLIEDAVESLNIQDCGDRRLCERRPCLNNAQCIDLSPTQYTCACPAQFTGTNCETKIDICVSRQPCQNGGQCVVAGSGFRCNCPLPWMGDSCNHREPLYSSVDVIGHGYVEFSKDLLLRQRRNTVEVIQVTIRTTEPNGLLFWQGQQPGSQGGKDYLALAVRNGYVEFRYELGSGPALIRSFKTVDDGYPHLIVAERLGRNGSLSTDNGEPVKGASKGALQVLNVQGNIYFGGVPDLGSYTADLFKENFIGCLTDVQLQNDRALSFDSDVLGGMNVSPCM